MPDRFFCHGLHVSRRQLPILRNAGLTLLPGQIAALTGPNGSGKTSLLEALAGLLPATGPISLAGHRLDRLPANRRARLGLRLVRDRDMVFPNLTVQENLGLVRPIKNGIRPPPLDAFPFIARRGAQLAGTLSGGEKRIVAIIMALLAHPRLLLIDEFSEGLHPDVIPALLANIEHHCDQGMMAMLVVHTLQSLPTQIAQTLRIAACNLEPQP